MNIQEILVTNGLGCAMLIILEISRHATRQRRRLDDRFFSALILFVALSCVTETLSFLVDGLPGTVYRILNVLFNTYLYAATLFTSVLWVLYVDMRLYRSRERLRAYRPLAAVAAVLLALLLVNAFVGFFFLVDENNVYHRVPTGYAFYLYLFVSLCISAYTVRRCRRERRRVLFFPLGMFLVPLFIGSVLQILFYGISLSWTCVALGLVGVYINLQSQQSFVDALTGLYNRQFLEHQLLVMGRDQRSSYYGIMLDLDYFKAINDHFGHSVGDSALRRTADLLLRAAAPVDAQAFRFAGDEFILLVRTAEEETVLQIEARLREETRRFNEEGEAPYTLSLSMGHARFDPAEDTADRFLAKMDTEMYADKERNHQRLDAR